MSESKVDWRNVCKDYKSRAEHILQNEIFTDCTFLVGQESDTAVKIRGHKLTLAVASPVFERMFYGSFDDGKSNEIRIPDIKHNIFNKMMDYIYSEKFPLMTVEDASELYCAAKKYMLQNLMERCSNFLIANFNTSNVWKIYEFAVFVEENILKNKAYNWMTLNTLAVFKDPAFVDANITSLVALFKSSYLNISSELDLLQALNEYGLANGYFDTKNSVTNKEAKPEIGKKELLRGALKQIRLLCLTPVQFDIVAKSGLMTESEVLSILWNLVGTGNIDHPMPEGFIKSKALRQQQQR